MFHVWLPHLLTLWLGISYLFRKGLFVDGNSGKELAVPWFGTVVSFCAVLFFFLSPLYCCRWEILSSSFVLALIAGAQPSYSSPRPLEAFSVLALQFVLSHLKGQVRLGVCRRDEWETHISIPSYPNTVLSCHLLVTDVFLTIYTGETIAWILPFTSGGFLYIALVNVVPDLLEEKNPW